MELLLVQMGCFVEGLLLVFQSEVRSGYSGIYYQINYFY